MVPPSLRLLDIVKVNPEKQSRQRSKKNAFSTSWIANLDDLIGRLCLGAKITAGVGVQGVADHCNPKDGQTNLANAGIQPRVAQTLVDDLI
jgi:hypothetical protein